MGARVGERPVEVDGPDVAEGFEGATVQRLLAAGWLVTEQRLVPGGTLVTMESPDDNVSPAGGGFRAGHSLDGQWRFGPGEGRLSWPWR